MQHTTRDDFTFTVAPIAFNHVDIASFRRETNTFLPNGQVPISAFLGVKYRTVERATAAYVERCSIVTECSNEISGTVEFFGW